MLVVEVLVEVEAVDVVAVVDVDVSEAVGVEVADEKALELRVVEELVCEVGAPPGAPRLDAKK